MEDVLEARERGAQGAAVAADAPKPHGKRHKQVYAALDLGTNNCRLLVAHPAGSGFRVVDAFSRIVRLGEGVSASGRLSDAAMARALEALQICARKIQDRNVSRASLIATEACRLAANGPEFLGEVMARTGLRLEIVDRETEARLAAAGCVSLVDPAADGAVLFDIGGGSTELVWLEFEGMNGARRLQLRGWVSLPVGVVTLSETFGGIVVTREIFEAMVTHVAGMVQRFEHREAISARIGAMHMLGTSGTVTTMAGLHLKLPRYDRRRVDGLWMSGTELSGVMTDLLASSYEERVANPCIGPERADLVMAGCAIFEAIRRAFPCERLRIADRGLREGLLVKMMERDGVWRRSLRR